MKTVVFIASAALFATAAASQDRADPPAAPGTVTQSALPDAPGKGEGAAVPATRPASDSGSMVNDVRIELALFGSGTRLSDVTDQVVQLLRSQPQGFTAHVNSLHADPTPGKNKSLLIRYRYRGQERLCMVTGQNRVSYAALVADDEDK